MGGTQADFLSGRRNQPNNEFWPQGETEIRVSKDKFQREVIHSEMKSSAVDGMRIPSFTEGIATGPAILWITTNISWIPSGIKQ